MLYACGDCYPSYKVISVKRNASLFELKGSDVDIRFADEKSEAEFYEAIGTCAICFEYNFEGTIIYDLFRMCYVVEVRQYQLLEYKKL
jgi:hypothetical protein